MKDITEFQRERSAATQAHMGYAIGACRCSPPCEVSAAPMTDMTDMKRECSAATEPCGVERGYARANERSEVSAAPMTDMTDMKRECSAATEPCGVERRYARANERSEVSAAPINGFLNVNKPAGITSHDVVYKLRHWTKIKRIGHAGTLDPDATGVLPIAIGSACRMISYLAKDKVYMAEVLLGIKTTTDDLSGTIMVSKELSPLIDRAAIETALQDFVGIIEQKPPLYSAVRHKGKRLHKLARAKQASYLVQRATENPMEQTISQTMDDMLSDLQMRTVRVESIDILNIDLPVIQLKIVCASGTYIRSIARDLGQALGCGASLKSLRRDKSGPFMLEHAWDMQALEQLVLNRRLPEALIGLERLPGWQVFEVELTVAKLISQGRILPMSALGISVREEPILIIYKALDSPECAGRAVALCRISDDQLIRPEVVLITPEDLATDHNPSSC